MKRFESKLKCYYVIVSILSILVFGSVQAFAQTSNKIVYHKGVKKKTAVKKPAGKVVKIIPKKNQNETKSVSPGDWGGTGISLSLQEGKIEVGFDCAEGVINNSLVIDQNGNFSLDGSYTPRSRGPIRTGVTPQNQNVRYEGKISGSSMSLKIISKDDGKLIGEFILVRNAVAKLRRCY